MTGTLASSRQVAARLCLLGAFRFESETCPIRFPTRKDESLLAYLALFPAPHAREKLAGLLWGDSPDVQTRRSLRTALATLLAGALLVAATLAFFAVSFARQSNQSAQRALAGRNNAEYQRQVAFARELSVNAVNSLTADPECSILLALRHRCAARR